MEKESLVVFAMKQLSSEYWPDVESVYVDWGILGKYAIAFFKTRDLSTIEENFRSKISFESTLWSRNNTEIRSLLLWLRTKGPFTDDNLMKAKDKTNEVLLRIATGKLNNLSIDKSILIELHNHMCNCYQFRRKIYRDYYFRHILGVPF